MTKQELIAEAKRIGNLTNGCAAGYCKFGGARKGQHHNGPCHCQADPDYGNRGPYTDYQYMATLLGLIASEFEVQEPSETLA